MDRSSGKNKTFCFITFRHACSVAFACELFNTLKLFQKPIYCKPSNSDPNKSSVGTNNSSSSPITGSPNYSTPVRPSYSGGASSGVDTFPPAFNQDSNSRGNSPLQQNRRDYSSEIRGGRASYDDRAQRRYEGDVYSARGSISSSGRRKYDDDTEELTRYDPRDDDRSRSYYRPSSNDERNHRYDNHRDNGRGNYDNSRFPRSANAPATSPIYLQAMNNQFQRGGGGSNYNNDYNSRDNCGPMRNNDPIQRHRTNRRQRTQPY